MTNQATVELKLLLSDQSTPECSASADGFTRRGGAVHRLGMRPMQSHPILTLVVLAAICFPHRTIGADDTLTQLDGPFRTTIQPFLETYCFTCHGKEKTEAEFDLTSYS